MQHQVYQLRTGRKLHLPQFPFEEHTSTALELNSVTSSDEENSEDKENIESSTVTSTTTASTSTTAGLWSDLVYSYWLFDILLLENSC